MRPELLTYFARNLPNPSDAEDLVQRVFERLLAVDPHPNLEALTRTVAGGLLKNAYRDHAGREADFETREWPGVRERTRAFEIALRGNETEKQRSAYRSANLDGEPLGWGVAVTEIRAGHATPFFPSDHDDALRGLPSEVRDAYILGELRGLTAREAGPLLGVHYTTAHDRREAATALIRKEIAA